VKLRLHGASAAVHDHVVGTPGDFDEVCARLYGARAMELRTGVTRANVRSLAVLAEWIAERGFRIARWTLAWPGPQPAGLALPRLGLVAPRVLHAAALGRRRGLIVVTEGLPPCVLGPHAEHGRRVEARAWGDVCKACPSRARCDGVPQHYLEQFAGDLELHPVDDSGTSNR